MTFLAFSESSELVSDSESKPRVRMEDNPQDSRSSLVLGSDVKDFALSSLFFFFRCSLSLLYFSFSILARSFSASCFSLSCSSLLFSASCLSLSFFILSCSDSPLELFVDRLSELMASDCKTQGEDNSMDSRVRPVPGSF